MDDQSPQEKQKKIPWQKSIATQLSQVTILVVVVAMITLGGVLIIIARQTQLDSVVESLRKSADKVALLISRYVDTAGGDLQLFLDTQHLNKMSLEDQKSALEALLISRTPRFSHIVLVNRDGSEKVRASRFHTYLPHELDSQAENPGFIDAIQGRSYLSDVYVSPDSGLLSLQMAFPCGAGNDSPIMIADINISQLWKDVSLINIGRTGYAYLVNVKGRFIAYQEPSMVLNRYGEDMSKMPPVAAFMAGKPVDSKFAKVYHGLRNETVIGLYEPIQGTDWAVIVEMPSKEAYSNLVKMQWYLIGLTFLGALVAGALVFVVSRRLIWPIHALTEAAERIASKDWDTNITGIRRHDEVGILAQVFSRMRDELRALYMNIQRQILELRHSKEELEESEARYRFLAEKMNDIIWTADLEFRVTYISPSIQKILGFSIEEFMKKDARETMTSESYSKAVELFESELERDAQEGLDPERSLVIEMEYNHKNGSTVWLENSMSAIRDRKGAIIGIHGVSRDITERKHAEHEKKRLEAQLAQAQKMESIGTLAGGIAHDFNNILSAIFGYTELAMDDASNPKQVQHQLKEVLRAGERARDLVKQILAFSRKAETSYAPVALRAVVKESLKMLRSVIPTTIEIQQELTDSGLVMSDPTQIHQIVMNLCTNAVHAMDEGNGILGIGLRKVDLGAGNVYSLDLAPGPYLKLSISDTGKGMTSSIMERMFDPYFTTKELGRGTGLGLSVVQGIVKSHGGAVVCRSKPDEGTTFDVYLPEIESAISLIEPAEAKAYARGNEHILFVDDEPSLVNLARTMLTKLGYKITTKTSPVEAYDLFQRDPGAFDLVITDMTMPGMRGDILSRKILEIRRDIPIIICTGYNEHISEDKAKSIGIRAYILKPLEMKALAETVRKILDERQEALSGAFPK